MTANLRGWAVCRDRWAGTVTVNDGTPTVITPAAYHSAWSAATYLDTAGPAWLRWSLTTDGKIRIYHASASTFSLTFSTSAIAARFGFASTSYSSAAEYTAGSVAPGAFAPYATDAGELREEFVHVDGRGIPLAAKHVRPSVAALEIRRPSVAFGVVAAQCLYALETWEYTSTPARLDIGYGSAPSLVRHDAESITVRWEADQSWGTIMLSLSEVLA